MSETSTVRDASMVLSHSIDSEDDFLMDIKKPTKIQPIITDEPDALQELDEAVNVKS